MTTQRQRQDTVRNSDTYDDNRPLSGSGMETTPVILEENLNDIRTLDKDWRGGADWHTPNPGRTQVQIDAALAVVESEADLSPKSGLLVPGDFSGNPKVASVAFATAYPDTSYIVSLGVETSNNKTYAPAVQNKTAAGFDLSLGSNSLTNFIGASWHTTGVGEV